MQDERQVFEQSDEVALLFHPGVIVVDELSLFVGQPNIGPCLANQKEHLGRLAALRALNLDDLFTLDEVYDAGSAVDVRAQKNDCIALHVLVTDWAILLLS